MTGAAILVTMMPITVLTLMLINFKPTTIELIVGNWKLTLRR